MGYNHVGGIVVSYCRQSWSDLGHFFPPVKKRVRELVSVYLSYYSQVPEYGCKLPHPVPLQRIPVTSYYT